MENEENQMNIIHVVENLDDRYGGPAISVPYTCKYLRDINVNARLLSVKLYSREENSVISKYGLPWESFNNIFLKKLKYSPKLKSAILVHIQKGNTILHSQSIWTYPTYCTYRINRIYKVPMVCSVRGTLYPWSLAQGKIQKKIAWQLFQKRMLNEADCVHVTEPNELSAVRKSGINSPIAMISNAVAPEVFEHKITRNQAVKMLGLDPLRRYFIFLSRLHKKKGLEFLIRAWAKLAQEFPDWHLLIAGTTENNAYLKAIKNAVECNNLSNRVTFLGMIKRDMKMSAFAVSELYILPSHTENFGIAIAEAMAAKLPVITTKGTPWKQVIEHNAGWWVELDDNILYRTMYEALKLPASQLAAMGLNGFKLVSEEYIWKLQAQKFKDLYSWILYNSSKPEFVYD